MKGTMFSFLYAQPHTCQMRVTLKWMSNESHTQMKGTMFLFLNMQPQTYPTRQTHKWGAPCSISRTALNLSNESCLTQIRGTMFSSPNVEPRIYPTRLPQPYKWGAPCSVFECVALNISSQGPLTMQMRTITLEIPKWPTRRCSKEEHFSPFPERASWRCQKRNATVLLPNS